MAKMVRIGFTRSRAPALAALVAIVVAFPMLLATAVAEPRAFRFTDPGGDVTLAGLPHQGADADTIDILGVEVTDAGHGLTFALQLRNLSALNTLALDPQFHSQHAVSFQSRIGHEGYSMRALFGGVLYTGNPLGEWSFQIHNRETNEWSAADGHQTGSTLRWTVAKDDLGVANGDVLTNWSVQSWNSLGPSIQSSDWADTPLTMEVGAPSETENGIAFEDPAGDVMRGGQPYSGPGADTTDVVAAELFESGDDLTFRLELVDLGGLAQEVSEEGFSAQFALGFRTRPDHEGYEMRAMFGGERYTGNPVGQWRFQIHDRQTDEWPEVDGHVEGSALVWSVDQSQFSLSDGDTMSDWLVQTWNSYQYNDQYGDWAQSTRAYIVGSAATAGGSDAPEPGPKRVAALPGAGLALGVAGTGAGLGWSAWWFRRVEPVSRPLWASFAFMGGFSRLQKDKLLYHGTREEIVESVRSGPGRTAGEVRRDLEIARSTFYYHLRRLEAQGLLRAQRGEGWVRLYPVGGPGPIAPIPLGPTALGTQVLQRVQSDPGRTAAEYARLLDKPPRSVRYQVQQPVRQGLLCEERTTARTIRLTPSSSLKPTLAR